MTDLPTSNEAAEPTINEADEAAHVAEMFILACRMDGRDFAFIMTALIAGLGRMVAFTQNHEEALNKVVTHVAKLADAYATEDRYLAAQIELAKLAATPTESVN